MVVCGLMNTSALSLVMFAAMTMTREKESIYGQRQLDSKMNRRNLRKLNSFKLKITRCSIVQPAVTQVLSSALPSLARRECTFVVQKISSIDMSAKKPSTLLISQSLNTG